MLMQKTVSLESYIRQKERSSLKKIRKKYDLPVYQRIPGFQFDIDKLISETRKIEDFFTNVISANKSFCKNNKSLVKAVLSSFDQIPLTEYDDSAFFNRMSLGSSEKETKLSKIQQYRMRIQRTNLDPALDERNYCQPTALYQGSYFEQCINKFRSKAIRVRLTCLKANTTIPPHIDYDPSYAVRVIIPILTNPKVINLFWVRGKTVRCHLPADGGAYFLNTGFKHGVENKSNTNRLCLMFSLNGQEDITRI